MQIQSFKIVFAVLTHNAYFMLSGGREREEQDGSIVTKSGSFFLEGGRRQNKEVEK